MPLISLHARRRGAELRLVSLDDAGHARAVAPRPQRAPIGVVGSHVGRSYGGAPSAALDGVDVEAGDYGLRDSLAKLLEDHYDFEGGAGRAGPRGPPPRRSSRGRAREPTRQASRRGRQAGLRRGAGRDRRRARNVGRRGGARALRRPAGGPDARALRGAGPRGPRRASTSARRRRRSCSAPYDITVDVRLRVGGGDAGALPAAQVPAAPARGHAHGRGLPHS